MPLELKEKPLDERGWGKFLELGLPAKEWERYRYVHFKELYDLSFHLPPSIKTDFKAQENRLVFHNGRYDPFRSSIPSPLIALPLTEASKTYGSFLNPRIQKLLKEENDPFAALNFAYSQDSLFLYLPPKAICEGPVHIVHSVDNFTQPTLLSPRIHLFLGKESSCSLVFVQKLAHNHVWVNSYIDCALEERASLKWTHLSEQKGEVHDFFSCRATLKKGSILKSTSATNGGITLGTIMWFDFWVKGVRLRSMGYGP